MPQLSRPFIRGMPPLKEVDKWYLWFLREMKKKHGEGWLLRMELTKEEEESLLRVHQAATRKYMERKRSK